MKNVFYAVQNDDNYDWDYGSENYDEAVLMANKLIADHNHDGEEIRIAVIDVDNSEIENEIVLRNAGMTVKMLHEKGALLCEISHYDGGEYLGSFSFWCVDGKIYSYSYHANTLHYSGDDSIDFFGDINDAREYLKENRYYDKLEELEESYRRILA